MPQAVPTSFSRNNSSKRTSAEPGLTSITPQGSKRRRTVRPITPQYPAVPGIGPSTTPQQAVDPVTHPSVAQGPPTVSGYQSLLRKPSGSISSPTASDVWYFMRKLDSREAPPSIPLDDAVLFERPDAPYVGCRLCKYDPTNLEEPGCWKTWNIKNGGSDSIRDHLKSRHGDQWREIVIQRKLKGWDTLLKAPLTADSDRQACNAQNAREPFKLARFHELLLRWMVADDQSVNVLENPEFRALLLYISENIDDNDIPHRTFATELIAKLFQAEHDNLRQDLQNSLGRISFTSDVWSALSLRGYLAITAHYLVKASHGHLELRARLVAFRYVEGSHTGATLAKHFLHVLQELGVVYKVGMITQDNAGNCGTMMEELSTLLAELDISFDPEGNRIRCFPHVINIAVQAGLKQLTKVDQNIFPDYPNEFIFPSDSPCAASNDALSADPAYKIALESDVINIARLLVNCCRSSGQRREYFLTKLRELGLPECVLLRAMDVRWSSTFGMGDRLLELYPAVKAMITELNLNQELLTDVQYLVLSDICKFLHAPHVVQELLSGERTPTLSLVIPTYEKLLTLLKLMVRKLGKIAHAIQTTINKLEHYFAKARRVRVYAIAMILNPTIRFSWIRAHWTADEYRQAVSWLRSTMLEYRQVMRLRKEPAAAGCSTREDSPASLSTVATRPTSRLPLPPSSRTAARSLASGYQRLNDLFRSYSDELNPGDASSDAGGIRTNETEAERENRLRLEDEAAVDAEIATYDEPVQQELEDLSHGFHQVDLITHWENSTKKLPILYEVSLDILPIQASSVPCERVFSSSKETDALRRSNLSPALFEILQILKFSVRQERLTFTEDWLPSESELASVEIPQVELDRLMAEGKINEMLGLIADAQRGTI